MKAACRKKNSRGFTLLEVLVALAIFATVAIMLNKQSSQAMRHLSHMQQKTWAIWLAENRAAELRLQKQWPAIGESTELVEMANRNWHVDTDVIETPNRYFRRVIIRVYDEDSDDRENSLYTLYTFVGQH